MFKEDLERETLTMKRKIKRLRLRERLDTDEPFSQEELDRRYRDVEERARKKHARTVARIKRKEEKERALRNSILFKPASAKFIELMQGIASTSPDQRCRAARRLAAHCAVVFREES
jgi:hypothetical protein